MPLEIEVLLTENQLVEQLIRAFKERYLPEKFFYWSPLSVKAWLELCRGAQPYKNYSRSHELVSVHAAAIAGALPEGEVEIVSLGSGQGDKDEIVLKEVSASGRALRYRPVDTSQSLLEMAVAGAAGAGFAARGLKADVADPMTVDALAVSANHPRLVLVLGNNLGLVDPLEFMKILRKLLRPADRLLIDAELYDPRLTMASYDNPVNRRFAFAPLAALGLEEGRDGSLVLETRADRRLAGLHTVSKRFHTARPVKITVAGQSIEFKAGEDVAMSPSWKYSREAFYRLLGEIGGFEASQEYSSEDGCFLMILASPRRA